MANYSDMKATKEISHYFRKTLSFFVHLCYYIFESMY